VIAAGGMPPQSAVVSDHVQNGLEHIASLLRLFRFYVFGGTSGLRRVSISPH
jgi:hypothetical protein